MCHCEKEAVKQIHIQYILNVFCCYLNRDILVLTAAKVVHSVVNLTT